MSFGKRKIPKHLLIHEFHPRPRRTHGVPWIFIAVLVLIASMIISARVNASPQDMQQTDYEEALNAGYLILKNNAGVSSPSIHVNTHVDVEINGLIAHTTFTQNFVNHTDQWREGVYLFPLPENAAVNGMKIMIGERVIVGEIKEKKQARNIYNAAKKAGKRSALTEQRRPNLFTQRLANIGPQESIEIQLTFVHPVTYRDGEFSWQLPTTITPKYFPKIEPQQKSYEPGITPPKEHIPDIPNYRSASFNRPAATVDHNKELAITTTQEQATIVTNDGWAFSTKDKHWPVPATLTKPYNGNVRNPISINIELNSGLPLSHISSLYHDITTNKLGETHRVRLRDGSANMDRDFVLQWQAVKSNTPQAALFSEKVDGDFYSLLMVIPPTNSPSQATLPKDMVFVIDISGSMSGTSIEQAKASLVTALSKLTSKDRFNIIAFQSLHSKLFHSLTPASKSNLVHATQWVNALYASGGTEMLPAINAALAEFDNASALQQTIFITDGAVGNETEMFKSIRKNIGNSRLFTVSIGSAPNSFFMKKAAQFGRGTFTQIGDINHVANKMDQLISKINSATAKNITINWPGRSVIYPSKVPDLYRSEPLIISAKSRDLSGDVLISGATANLPWSQHISLANQKSGKGISSIWARAKIEDLEDFMISGGDKDVLKREITDIALRHKLLSRYTSFVAVENVRARPDNINAKTTPIPNQNVKGYSPRPQLTPIQYPSTATSAQMSWWLGLLFILFILIVRRMNND